MTAFDLTELERIVARRADSQDGSSYTARLKAAGIGKASQKLGEEAVETVIAAISGNEADLVGEASDLLYHLLVVLHLRGVPLADILTELQRRTAETGLEEKARRSLDPAKA